MFENCFLSEITSGPINGCASERERERETLHTQVMVAECFLMLLCVIYQMGSIGKEAGRPRMRGGNKRMACFFPDILLFRMHVVAL